MSEQSRLEENWYLVEQIDTNVFAIGEPLYAQQNWSYLFVGAERSLLFDTGSYLADMTPVIERITTTPLTALPSHMHYDHLGNVERFDHVAIADLPIMRACTQNGFLTPTDELFLGEEENRNPPVFKVHEWLEINQEIDLGGIRLRVLHTTGHSPDSISLWHESKNRLFTADFLYPGSLYAQTPGASLKDYLKTAIQLRKTVNKDTKLFAAHGNIKPGTVHTAPTLKAHELDALITCIETLRKSPLNFAESETHIVPVSGNLQLLVSEEAYSTLTQ